MERDRKGWNKIVRNRPVKNGADGIQWITMGSDIK